jgi:ubiquinone/menaquinone biosynthesis C-methylase UbiE
MDAATMCEEIALRLGRVESVLDVGCGDGMLVRCLAERIAREAIGIDIAGSTFSERWVSKVSKDSSSHLAKCMEGNAHAMKFFADNRFDAVVTVITLHELSDPVVALREAKRVLKPGGMILIADFEKGHEGERIWGETYYTSEQVDTMLKKCSFEEVSVQQVPGEHFLFVLGKKMKGP